MSETTSPDRLRAILDELAGLGDERYPVTTPVDPALPIYTRSNAKEIFPDVATPATWSSVGGGLDRAFGRAHADLGLIPEPDPGSWRFLGLFYGRASLCYSAHGQVTRRSFGAPWWPWGGRGVRRAGVDAAAYEPPADVRTWLGDLWWRLRSWRRVRRVERELPRRVDGLAQELDEVLRAEQEREVASMSLPALLEVLAGQSVGARILEAHLTATFFAGSYYALLERRLRSWTSLPPGPTAGGLLVGLGSLDSTRPATELAELATLVRAAPRLAGLLTEGDLEGFAAAVAEPGDEAERAVADARAAFLREHGHRTVGEAEMRSRTWGEDPGQVDRVLATHLRVEGERTADEPQAKRRELEQRVLAHVRPWQRSRLRRAIDGAQRFSALRERTKSLTVRNGSKNKRLMREIGNRFLDDGIVEHSDDLTLLTRDELLSARDGATDHLPEVVARRRRAYELFEQLDLPEETFAAPPEPVLREEIDQRGAGEGDRHGDGVLSGMGVSPGRVEGIARVVRDPRGDTALEPGEVLVAPHTDAAWSPLFMLAGGVVVDTGGMISHGAIVARDLGLPAVVNVPGTERIRDGDHVVVDGDVGTVEILGGRP